LSYLIQVDGVSDIGQTRARNEDSFACFADLGVAVVADGMGGHPGGDIASQVAAREAEAHLREHLPRLPAAEAGGDPPVAALGETMATAVMAAHSAIRAQGEEDPMLAGMGTTLTAMAVQADWMGFGIGHVGDSRAYRLRGGRLVQLTRDDTWVQDRVEGGDLTPEQARRHPFGHILTQCLGLDDAPTPHVVTGEVEAGDIYLLCTDGLVGMLEDEAIVDLLTHSVGEPPQRIAQRLVDAANENGGHDNITATVIVVAGGE
jgi:protein phosphatase